MTTIKGVSRNAYTGNQLKVKGCSSSRVVSGCDGGWFPTVASGPTISFPTPCDNRNDYQCANFTLPPTNPQPPPSIILAPALQAAIPTIGGGKNNYNSVVSYNVNPTNANNLGSCSNSNTCQAVVEYNVSDFKTQADVNNFAGFYLTTPVVDPVTSSAVIDDFNTVLLPAFCQTPNTTAGMCPNGATSCSRYLSLDPQDSQCHNYYFTTNQTYFPYLNSSISSYCNVNPTDPQCACNARNFIPLYNELSGGNDVSDQCWWKPCANSSEFLVTSDLRVSCPTTSICENIINNIAGSSSKINEALISQYINCSGAKPNTGGNTPPGPSFFEQYKWIIIGIAIIIILALVIFLAIKIFSNKKPKNLPNDKNSTSDLISDKDFL